MKTLNDKLLTVVKNLDVILKTLQAEPSRADINAAALRTAQTLEQVRAIIDDDDDDEEFTPKVPKKKTQSEPGRVTKGYHTTTIPKGKYGELSKVHEELAELVDAQNQGAKLLVFNEVSDLLGAIEGFVQTHYPNTLTMEDLLHQARLTAAAFQSGERT